MFQRAKYTEQIRLRMNEAFQNIYLTKPRLAITPVVNGLRQKCIIKPPRFSEESISISRVVIDYNQEGHTINFIEECVYD